MSPEILEKLPSSFFYGGFIYLFAALMIRLRPAPFELKKRYDSLPSPLKEKREAVNFEIAVRTLVPFFVGLPITSFFESILLSFLTALVPPFWTRTSSRV